MNARTKLSNSFHEYGDISDLEGLRLSGSFLRSSDLIHNFGADLALTQHESHTLSMFADPALIELLDRHPRRYLQCFTMGSDPEHPEEWQAVCIRGCSGAEIFEALQRGRIWVNVTNIDKYEAQYKQLISRLYDELEELCPDLQSPQAGYNTLVLASPGTQFYYHINPENNMLWHMNGNLRLSTLPAMDLRFVTQELLEEIFACEASGSIEYKNEFAKYAQQIDVAAGDCAWWPQSAPIRMEYETFCVSLITSYFCPVLYKRELVQLANRYLLRRLGVSNRSMREDGLSSELKQLLYRSLRKFKTFHKAYDFTDEYTTKLKVNVSEPNCIETLPRDVIPEFSKMYASTARK